MPITLQPGRVTAEKRFYDDAAKIRKDYLSNSSPVMPMMGNAHNRTTGVSHVNPYASQLTNNVSGAQTNMSSQLPQSYRYMRGYSAPQSVPEIANAYRQEAKQNYLSDPNAMISPAGANRMASMRNTQANQDFLMTPGGEDMSRRFLNRGQNMLQSGGQAGRSFTQEDYQLAQDRTTNANNLKSMFDRSVNLEDSGMRIDPQTGLMTRVTRDRGVALTGSPATDEQIAANQKRITDRRAANGGISELQIRRLDQKRDGYSRAVRQGILTQDQATEKLSYAADRAGVNFKDYLAPSMAGAKAKGDMLGSMRNSQASSAIANPLSSDSITPRLADGVHTTSVVTAANKTLNELIRKSPEGTYSDPDGQYLESLNLSGIPEKASDMFSANVETLRVVRGLPSHQQVPYARAVAKWMQGFVRTNKADWTNSVTNNDDDIYGKKAIQTIEKLDISDTEKLMAWFNVYSIRNDMLENAKME